MPEFELTEVKSLSEILALGRIRVKREQRRYTKNVFITYLQTRHPAVTTYRIDIGDDPIGYVMLVQADNPTQWIIERLTIDADYQGQGYGFAVADYLVDIVHDFDNSEMLIARYRPNNEGARRLFERLGFEEQDKIFRGRQLATLEFEFEEDDDADDDDEDSDSDAENGTGPNHAGSVDSGNGNRA